MAIGFSGGFKSAAVLSHFQKVLGDGPNVVRVGFMENSTCGINNDAPAPEIAFILEHGAPAANIPPRPFFRAMITKNSPKWGKILMAFLKRNGFDARLGLKGLGLVMGEQLQLSITQTTEPPNRPSTVEAKGFNKPLEHSKNLKRAVSYEVGGDIHNLGEASNAKDSAQLASFAGKTLLKGF